MKKGKQKKRSDYFAIRVSPRRIRLTATGRRQNQESRDFPNLKSAFPKVTLFNAFQATITSLGLLRHFSFLFLIKLFERPAYEIRIMEPTTD